MEPIEKEIAERKALMKEWAAEIYRLEVARATLSGPHDIEAQRRISRLRYKIHTGQFALKDLEELAAVGREAKTERPPLPNARRLSDEERQRIADEARTRLIASMNLSEDESEIQIHVGRMTDERGNPRVSISVGRAPRNQP